MEQWNNSEARKQRIKELLSPRSAWKLSQPAKSECQGQREQTLTTLML